jgi:hypothetical protein
MTTSFLLLLAIALPSLRISPLLLIRIATIALLYAAALSFNVVYIQSIGSGIGIYSGLFPDFLNIKLTFGLEELLVLHFSSVPVKPKRLTTAEKEAFSLTEEIKQIIVGLILGDLHVCKRIEGKNTSLNFEQGIVHKDYIYHLFDLFESYCPSSPKISNRLPDKRTGNIYTRIQFNTYTLPCFNEFYGLFYPLGLKIVPLAIGELLTPLSLAYWLCDDGTFDKGRGVVRFCTESFSESDVDLLLGVFSNKFGLKCRKDYYGNGFRIIIVKSSLNKFRELVRPHLPSCMLYKIGL